MVLGRIKQASMLGLNLWGSVSASSWQSRIASWFLESVGRVLVDGTYVVWMRKVF